MGIGLGIWVVHDHVACKSTWNDIVQPGQVVCPSRITAKFLSSSLKGVSQEKLPTGLQLAPTCLRSIHANISFYVLPTFLEKSFRVDSMDLLVEWHGHGTILFLYNILKQLKNHRSTGGSQQTCFMYFSLLFSTFIKFYHFYH